VIAALHGWALIGGFFAVIALGTVGIYWLLRWLG
jgi:roadblock/LC7 domain-containing protein